MPADLVLVTGAAGFIGKSVCRYLLANGYRVRALVRSTSRPLDNHPFLEKVFGDMQDAASLEKAAAGVRWVAHLAAAKSDERDSHETNVRGAENLIAACRKNGVEFIINVSTQSAKIRRKGTYAATKEAADQVFQSSGFPVTILRSSLVYGDLSGGVFASLIKFSRLPVVPVMGSGKTWHWPIQGDDLAKAIELAATNPATRGKIYDVGGPDKANVNELLREFLRRQNLRRPVIHIPIWAGLLMARAFSFLPRPPFTRSNVLGSNEDVDMDVERFFHDFGFTPRRLKDGLDGLFQSRPVPADYSVQREAGLLLTYIMAASGVRWEPGPEEKALYSRALAFQVSPAGHRLDNAVYNHPWILGGLDAVSRLFFPRSILQQKIIVAASLVECLPASALWLLPKDRTRIAWLGEILRIIARIFLKGLVGIILFLFPGFLRRNVGSI